MEGWRERVGNVYECMYACACARLGFFLMILLYYLAGGWIVKGELVGLSSVKGEIS